MRMQLGMLGAVALAVSTVVAVPGSAQAEEPVEEAPMLTTDVRVPMSDGVELLARVGGRGPHTAAGHLPARPTILEFSPYAPGCCPEHGGPEFNHVQVHIRGTGSSGGVFDALGPRSQRDVAEVLAWACEQPWSEGRLGLWGYSASAIVAYNSLHQELPCLESAVLVSGTHELYRDLLYPGGIPNAVPALGVFAGIGGPTLATAPERLAGNPLAAVKTVAAYAQLAVDFLAHPTLDGWWRERGMRGDVNGVPVLVVNGFFDVEARGPFEAFQELVDAGTDAHLYVVGAHEGVPEGTGGATEVTRRWFDRHLRGIDDGLGDEPRVQLWLADGDRVAMKSGRYVTASADAWPVPGTEWVPLHLGAGRSGSAATANDGTLGLRPPRLPRWVPHLPLPSLPTATDVPTTALLGAFDAVPALTGMDLAEPLGLSWTTPPLADDVVLAGPVSLELALTQVVPESDLWVVVSDVHPDGRAHPMATGRLRTSYPDLVPERTRYDETGAVVQPYADHSTKRFVPPGREHRYHVELWPIGNRFQAGHRLRVHVVGASGFSLPTVGGPQLIRLGGGDGGSVLRVPVLPGSDLRAALAS